MASRFDFGSAKGLLGEHSGAIFSDPVPPTNDRLYRYALWRMWDITAPYICLVLLNPSTADEVTNDNTVEGVVRRVHGWRRRGLDMRYWGGVVVVNLFGWRATDRKQLRAVRLAGGDIVGPRNDEAVARFAEHAGLVICGWGGEAELAQPGRAAAVLAMLASRAVPLHAFAVNDDGTPQHPLYIGHEVLPLPYGGTVAPP